MTRVLHGWTAFALVGLAVCGLAGPPLAAQEQGTGRSNPRFGEEGTFERAEPRPVPAPAPQPAPAPVAEPGPAPAAGEQAVAQGGARPASSRAPRDDARRRDRREGRPHVYDPRYSGPGYGGGHPYGPNGYEQGGYAADHYEGSLRLKVRPRDAHVFVDGYYVGVVDDFDGIFQRLRLEAGPHRIEIRAPGREAVTVDVRVEPDQSMTYRGELSPGP